MPRYQPSGWLIVCFTAASAVPAEGGEFAEPAEPFSAPQPVYPPLAPPFAPTWDLARSTIIHTGNASGFTDAVAAGKYGIASFDWGNNKLTWCQRNCSTTFNEGSLIEQAKRVKAASNRTKVLVYRAANIVQPWQESQRAVMYNPLFAGFFLRCADGSIWHRGDSAKTGSCGGFNLTESGKLCDYSGSHTFFWNFTNASAAEYFINTVCMGPLGTDNEFVDGIYMDDPGPGTRDHPMNEYIEVLRAPALGMNMSNDEIAAIASATYRTMLKLRERLQHKGKFVWLHAVDFASPFRDAAYTNCTGGYGLCGWWLQPIAGDDCSEFYRRRCGKLEQLPLSVKMDPLQRHDGWAKVTNLTAAQGWNLTIATMLLLRGPQAYLVPSGWQQTSSTSPLLWSPSLELRVGTPVDSCKETAPNVFERRWSTGRARVDCNVRTHDNNIDTLLAFPRSSHDQ